MTTADDMIREAVPAALTDNERASIPPEHWARALRHPGLGGRTHHDMVRLLSTAGWVFDAAYKVYYRGHIAEVDTFGHGLLIHPPPETQTHKGRLIALPCRRVRELVGPVEQRIRVHGPKKCKRGCDDPYHRPERGIYVSDERADSDMRSYHNAQGRWVTFYADWSTVHEDVRAAWGKVVGPNNGSSRLATLKIIPWPDGRVVVIAEASNMIFDQWLTIDATNMKGS